LTSGGKLAAVNSVTDIKRLELWNIKIGLITNVCQAAAVLKNGRTVKFVINVAKDLTCANKELLRTYQAMCEDYQWNPYYIMEPFALEIGKARTWRGEECIPIMVGEWLEDYHELHPELEDGYNFSLWGDQGKSVDTLTTAESDKVWQEITRIRAIYSRITQQGAVVPQFYAQAGDFVCRRQPDGTFRVMVVWSQRDCAVMHRNEEIVLNALLQGEFDFIKPGHLPTAAWWDRFDLAIGAFIEGCIERDVYRHQVEHPGKNLDNGAMEQLGIRSRSQAVELLQEAYQGRLRALIRRRNPASSLTLERLGVPQRAEVIKLMRRAYIVLGRFLERERTPPPQDSLRQMLPFSGQELRTLLTRSRILRNIYNQLSFPAKKILLHPDIITVFLGIRPGYICYAETDDPQINPLAKEIMNIAEARTSLGLLFAHPYIISIPHFIARLKTESDFLVRRRVISSQERDHLLGDWNVADEFCESSRLLGKILDRYIPADVPGRIEMHGFICGYPLADIEAAAESPATESQRRDSFLLKSRYGFMVRAVDKQRTGELLFKWDMAADWGYSRLSSEPDFAAVMPQKALESFQQIRKEKNQNRVLQPNENKEVGGDAPNPGAQGPISNRNIFTRGLRLLSKLRLILVVLLFLILPLQSLKAQAPVTGGTGANLAVDKALHSGLIQPPTRLYPDIKYDLSEQQQKIYSSGKPLEFTRGFLYHGRDGLDEVLLIGKIPGESYLTRVPQVWAIRPFVKSSTSPAIFVINALSFNRLMHKGYAVLEGEYDEVTSGIKTFDPYPKITDNFSLKIVLAIWTDEDTWERYIKILNQPGSELDEKSKCLKPIIKDLIAQKKLSAFPGLHHTQIEDVPFQVKTFEIVEAHFMRKKLDEHIPQFRIRRDTPWLFIGVGASVGIGCIIILKKSLKPKSETRQERRSRQRQKGKK